MTYVKYLDRTKTSFTVGLIFKMYVWTLKVKESEYRQRFEPSSSQCLTLIADTEHPLSLNGATCFIDLVVICKSSSGGNQRGATKWRCTT